MMNNKKLAILIDADNAPADIIDAMLEEIAKYGTATVKRIYGDWSHGLSKWKAVLLPHALIPVQQFAYTKGKNATDMALVIDAMDLLYSNNFDGFCLVSSDSDFTRLASRIRENGLVVYGFGEKKTPESFRKACDKFTYIEIFRPQKNTQPPKAPSIPPSESDTDNSQPNLTQLIKRAVKENADDFGWANLAPVGSYISKISPDFDPRLYGFAKLSELIKSLDVFEHRTENNQLQIRTLKTDNNPPSKTRNNRLPEKKRTAKNTAENQSNPITVIVDDQLPINDTHNNPNKKNKIPFSKIIPIVQQAINATADAQGWASLANAAKQLDSQLNVQQYGYSNSRELIRTIYNEWIEIKKVGRGERVRNQKIFIPKTNA